MLKRWLSRSGVSGLNAEQSARLVVMVMVVSGTGHAEMMVMVASGAAVVVGAAEEAGEVAGGDMEVKGDREGTLIRSATAGAYRHKGVSATEAMLCCQGVGLFS